MSSPLPDIAAMGIHIIGTADADNDDKIKHRRASDDVKTVGSTTATYSSKGSSGLASGTATSSNIWTRLLSSESVWDSLNVVTNNEYDDGDDDELAEEEEDDEHLKWYHLPLASISLLCLTAWYETRHFFKTLAAHPRIWLSSLAVTCLILGLGMWAIASKKETYVQDRMNTAEFVARETATWFSNEFKRAFLPLYSLREAVRHSGHFDELASEIGRYPNLMKGEGVEVAGGLANVRNVSGICDEEGVLEKWAELVSTSTDENDLNGMITRYRLMPQNVACLEYKANRAMMDSGMDMSNSPHPFWSMVVTDLFVERWKGLHVFGPFKAGPKEMFCTHLAIWNKAPPGASPSYTNIQGTEVENVWGFVMNYLDWGELKERSKMFERFANVGMDFRLMRREEDVDPELSGPKGEPTNHYAMLAESEDGHLLDESNSILIETESLHGIWQNRVGIASENGWNPTWWWPAVAAVVVNAILLGLLTAISLYKGQLHRDLVEKMMPKQAIKKLHRGQTVVEKYNLITVFYADAVGFSSKAGGTMSPVQVLSMLNDLYSEFDNIAKRHGVYKVETVGNRYMVVGGAPKQESARVAAKRVALFAIDAMAYVDNMFLTTTGDKLFIRAGISSGPAVAGCVGKAMPRYCFFGQTVDLALKLEKTSKKMKIQCSEVTYRLLRDAPSMKFVLTKREINKGEEFMINQTSTTYWIEKASPCENCFDLTNGSWILDPCGHVLCAECNGKHNLNVCPTCRRKVNGRTEWKIKNGPNKILDIDDASFVLPEDICDDCFDLEAAEQARD